MGVNFCWFIQSKVRKKMDLCSQFYLLINRDSTETEEINEHLVAADTATADIAIRHLTRHTEDSTGQPPA